MIIDGYGAEDINNNAMKSMNQYILKRNPELIDRKVIEDIKAEIKTKMNLYQTWDRSDYQRYAEAFKECLEIIDKHIGE